MGNDGILTGGSLGTGRMGSGYEFDGNTDNNIIVAQDSSLQPDYITVSAWIKSVDVTNQDMIMAQDSGGGTRNWYFWLDASGRTKFSVYNRTADRVECAGTSSPCLNNEWCFVTGTFDGSNIKVYRDGTLIGTCAHKGMLEDNSLDQYIGMRQYGGNENPFNGTIDEVRIYDRSLSIDEIKALYSQSSEFYAGTAAMVNVKHSNYPACSGTYEGMITYNASDNVFYGCNSTAWSALG